MARNLNLRFTTSDLLLYNKGEETNSFGSRAVDDDCNPNINVQLLIRKLGQTLASKNF